MMQYEFYDREGNFIGDWREPGGRAVIQDEEMKLNVVGQTATQWKVIAASEPVSGVQNVTVRPI